MSDSSLSLTERIIEEMNSAPIQRSCCQKAYLCGLLYGSVKIEGKKEYAAFLYRESTAVRVAEILDNHFRSVDSQKTQVLPSVRGGHKGFSLTVSSKAIVSVLHGMDERKYENLSAAIGFRCAECERSFYKGVFESSATLSRPQNGYHLEFSVLNEERADLLSDAFEQSFAAAGRVRRGKRLGLYYKSSSKISDLLYCFGAPRASFELTNISIEREIRNNENRATNCDTRNILRSVGATMKHVEAINYLIKEDKITVLGEELEYTARLRLEYDSASLSELAALHEPPISKSGLNSRLTRILSIAQEYKKS